jgi:mRNA interferase RelE/StbE
VSYRIFILRRAQKELANLNTESYDQAKEVIRQLAENPRPSGCKKLIGRDGWRIRFADYRVIYEIDDKNQIVTILHIGHRKDIYR